MHEWLCIEGNFTLINGGAGHRKLMGSGVKMKVTDGHHVLADHMNRKFHTTWDHLTAKNRLSVWKSKYLSAKSQAEGSGFGITEADISSGVRTVEEKLEKLCFMFVELDQLFGHCANVVPMHVSQTNVPKRESKDKEDKDRKNNAMNDKDQSSTDGEDKKDRNSNGADQLQAGDKEPNNPVLPADQLATATTGSVQKKRSKAGSKKGKAAVDVDISSDSDLDSASALGKKQHSSVSLSAAKPTRTSFASSYMESQVSKLDLMEKQLVAQTKSAEATLALQQEELMRKRGVK
ncbi:hypothetical protein BJ741DRAFT_676474 [Chytriomyces cf. hyalinus JEL632]|nr:hypothetical protein BJ741DRAFT_676474 [Chytriomyces cf. hyalinus JEL632]